MERFIVAPANGGFELSGLILQAHEDAPYVARYMIQVDESWRTRKVEVELENGGRRSLSMTGDGAGHWSSDGQRFGQVAECIEVDLEWSPSTNTLPIRRLGLAHGETQSVAAAWVRFPSLEVQRLEQSYECLDQHRYRYRSGRFTADLAVDDDDMVMLYGANWKAAAIRGELGQRDFDSSRSCVSKSPTTVIARLASERDRGCRGEAPGKPLWVPRLANE